MPSASPRIRAVWAATYLQRMKSKPKSVCWLPTSSRSRPLRYSTSGLCHQSPILTQLKCLRVSIQLLILKQVTTLWLPSESLELRDGKESLRQEEAYIADSSGRQRFLEGLHQHQESQYSWKITSLVKSCPTKTYQIQTSVRCVSRLLLLVILLFSSKEYTFSSWMNSTSLSVTRKRPKSNFLRNNCKPCKTTSLLFSSREIKARKEVIRSIRSTVSSRSSLAFPAVVTGTIGKAKGIQWHSL